MTAPTSFRAVIELWPSREAMAVDIGAGASDWIVSKWWQRDTIPAEWWSLILATERATRAGVTADMMTEWASRVPAEVLRAAVEARV